MFRAVIVCLLALSSAANAQSFPDQNLGLAIAAKPARVSLTADGPWLPTAAPAKSFLSVYDDSTPRLRFGDSVDGARLLFYVERDALRTLVVSNTAFLQPTEAATPGKDVFLSEGFVPYAGMIVEVLAPEKAGLVKVRITSGTASGYKLEVTGFMPPASIGTTFRISASSRPAFKATNSVKNLALLDKPKGTPFLTITSTTPQLVMVLQRSGAFALVRVENSAVGWIASKELAKLKPESGGEGEEGGEEGGVAGGMGGGLSQPLTLADGTPLFDRIDGTFVGVASRFDAIPAETKGAWKRYSLTTPYGSVSVWASSAIGAPQPPQNISPTILESFRIAGEKQIVPDDDTKTKIMEANKSKIIGSWKLCIDVTGAITRIQALKSTGFPDYDKKIEAGMAAWKYKPYTYNGKAIPVCTAITFIYSQT